MNNATNRLLDRVAAKIGKTSSYAIAKAFGVSSQRIQGYRAGRSQMEDDAAMVAAEILGDDPGAILAELHADRSKSEAARKQWNRIAKMLRAEDGHRAAA